MPAAYDLKKCSDGQFMFNLKAGNNQVILTSERYKTRASAEKGIASVRKNSQADKRFQRKVAKNGQHYFCLTATNGETIGRSEMYTGKSGMENGIQSVMKNGPTDSVRDLT